MKILIIYSTRAGVSRKCSEMLAEKLKGSFEVSVYDIKDNPPAPNDFDVCVVGGSIRMARINKRLKAYLKAHAEALSSKHTALFLCCGFTESFDDYVAMQFPKNIIASLGIHCFGGEMKPDKLKGLDKLVIKTVLSQIKYEEFDDPDPKRSPIPEILPETIYRLADRIRALL